MKLSECRAVITGASGGIGQALVAALLLEGAHLLLVGRQAEAHPQAAWCQGRGGSGRGCPGGRGGSRARSRAGGRRETRAEKAGEPVEGISG